MNLLKKFDVALMKEETVTGSLTAGYIPEGKVEPYNEYLANKCWKKLLDDMNTSHRASFCAGGGKELDEKDGKPPKMAAFASSSRMLYMLAKDEPGFVFEEKLTTTVGGMANLDGYLSLPGRHIFVEAKCREPYGHKAEQVIKQNYKGVYEYLQRKMPGVFSCVMEDIPEKRPENPERNMRVTFFCKDNVVHYFDIKQMICHLLAVATKQLKKPDSKNILFLYLLHDPTNMDLPQKARDEILNVYQDTCWAAMNFDFKTMFGHIVDYLMKTGKFKADDTSLAVLKQSFEFRLCSKADFIDYVRQC